MTTTNNTRRIMATHRSTKTYRTQAAAQSAFNSLVAEQGLFPEGAEGESFRFVVSVAPDGRFHPVALLTQDQHRFALIFAHRGFMVA